MLDSDRGRALGAAVVSTNVVYRESLASSCGIKVDGWLDAEPETIDDARLGVGVGSDPGGCPELIVAEGPWSTEV